MIICRKSIPGRRKSKYKGPEVGVCLTYLEKSEEARVAEYVGEREREMMSEIERDGGACHSEPQGHVETLVLY